MASMTKEYVLVHGAAHGAWCWDGVAERLRARGHRVVSLDADAGHDVMLSEPDLLARMLDDI